MIIKFGDDPLIGLIFLIIIIGGTVLDALRKKGWLKTPSEQSETQPIPKRPSSTPQIGNEKPIEKKTLNSEYDRQEEEPINQKRFRIKIIEEPKFVKDYTSLQMESIDRESQTDNSKSNMPILTTRKEGCDLDAYFNRPNLSPQQKWLIYKEIFTPSARIKFSRPPHVR